MRVDAEIERLSELLDSRCEQYEKLAVRAAQCEAEYKIAYAREYLDIEVKMPVDTRKQSATYACRDLLTEHLLAEGVGDSCQESMRSIRAQLSALQTLAANERASLTG